MERREAILLVIPLLIERLKDKDSQVRAAAASIFRSISAPIREFGAPYLRDVADQDAQLNTSILFGLQSRHSAGCSKIRTPLFEMVHSWQSVLWLIPVSFKQYILSEIANNSYKPSFRMQFVP